MKYLYIQRIDTIYMSIHFVWTYSSIQNVSSTINCGCYIQVLKLVFSHTLPYMSKSILVVLQFLLKNVIHTSNLRCYGESFVLPFEQFSNGSSRFLVLICQFKKIIYVIRHMLYIELVDCWHLGLDSFTFFCLLHLKIHNICSSKLISQILVHQIKRSESLLALDEKLTKCCSVEMFHTESTSKFISIPHLK